MRWVSLLHGWLSSIVNVNPWLSSMVIGFMMSVGFITSLTPLASTFLITLIASGFNPLYFSTLFGFGAMLGEMVTYTLGYSSRVLMERRIKGKKLEKLKRFRRFLQTIERWTRSGEVLVFIFAASPLPDDLLLIYLGLKKFPFRRIVLPCWIGKIVLGLIYSGLIKGALRLSGISEPLLTFALIFGSFAFLGMVYLWNKRKYLRNKLKIKLK